MATRINYSNLINEEAESIRNLIAYFREISVKDSITPETLGALLEKLRAYIENSSDALFNALADKEVVKLRVTADGEKCIVAAVTESGLAYTAEIPLVTTSSVGLLSPSMYHRLIYAHDKVEKYDERFGELDSIKEQIAGQVGVITSMRQQVVEKAEQVALAANKVGAPGGFAPLGDDGKVPQQYLPSLASGDASLSQWQQEYLNRLEAAEVVAKFVVTLTTSLLDMELTGEPVNIGLSVTSRYEGVGVQPAVSALTSNLNGVTFEGGSAQAVWSPPATSEGKESITYGIRATYNALQKEAYTTKTLYAPMRWVSKAAEGVPTSEEINAGVKTVAASAAGTYTFGIPGGEYLWLCVPAFMTITSITSSGFQVPVLPEEQAQCTIGSTVVTYRCIRLAGRPQSTSITLKIE